MSALQQNWEKGRKVSAWKQEDWGGGIERAGAGGKMAPIM
jgi:hypothetical protein